MEKKWYKTNWGVIFLLLIFFPVGLYLMWKYSDWSKKTKRIITGIIVVILILIRIMLGATESKQPVTKSEGSCVGPDGKRIQLSSEACKKFNDAWKNKPQESKQEDIITPKPTMQITKAPTSTPKPTIKPTAVSKKITEKIDNLVAEKYPNFEVTIWNKNSDLASEGQIPYEVVLNGSFNKTVATSCDGAKKLSYYMLETFYKDSEIRPTLSRIMITIPYYLRVSLGASDGVPMEKSGSFSGPTNFWTVMENMGLGENESGEMKNRTWGNYLTKCE